MKSLLFALATLGLFLTFIECKDKISVAEYQIKRGLLSGGRAYDITSNANAKANFSVRYEPSLSGRKLFLLQDGKERYILQEHVFHFTSTWSVIDPIIDKELGRIQNAIVLYGATITAKGDFGLYKINGDFGRLSYTISKDDRQVAKIEKKSYDIHHTYDLTVYGKGTDQALMVLFTMAIDIIRNGNFK